MSSRDWRLPENRREAFQRFYSFHLEYRTHPGCVYFALPAIADAYDLDDDGRAWLAWLNGNTQNPAMSLLLLEAAPRPDDWQLAVDFWNEHFKLMDFDTDRRHQKSKFGVATEQWAQLVAGHPAELWYNSALVGGWESVWDYAKSQPYFGRLSAWSGLEYARILLGADAIPDMGSWLLQDVSGSRSHRNGVAVVKGYDAWNWNAEDPFMLGIVEELEAFADELLEEADRRNAILNLDQSHVEGVAMYDRHPDVGRLTMESALCTYKSWHKPNRRYPNVYADMMYNRLKKAEARFGDRFQILWDARRAALPEHLRLEDCPNDPGLSPVKQNWYRETGEVVMMDMYDDMTSGFHAQLFPPRKDPKW